MRLFSILALLFTSDTIYGIKFPNVFGGLQKMKFQWKRKSSFRTDNSTELALARADATAVSADTIFSGRCLEYDLCFTAGAFVDGLTPCVDVVDGTHRCACPAGYTVYSDGICKGTDYCSVGENAGIGALFCPDNCIVDSTSAVGYRCNCAATEYFAWFPFAECIADPCAANPCGTGTCTAQQADLSTGGYAYTCTCTAPEIFSGGTCVDTCATVVQGTDDCTACKQDKSKKLGYYCTCPADRVFDQNSAGCVNPCTDTVQFNGNVNCKLKDSGSTCVPTTSSTQLYICKCSSGFVMVATTLSVTCSGNPCYTADSVDSNPCNNYADSTASCVPSSDATTYTCKCSSGYNSVNGACKDQDECTAYSNPCGGLDSKAICTNTNGSFSCACSKGYQNSNTGQCIDIDECTSTSNACRQHGDKRSQCLNFNGGYGCTCSIGFTFFDGTCKVAAPIQIYRLFTALLTGIRLLFALPFIVVGTVLFQLFWLIAYPFRLLLGTRLVHSNGFTNRLIENVDILQILSRVGRTIDMDHLEL